MILHSPVDQKIRDRLNSFYLTCDGGLIQVACKMFLHYFFYGEMVIYVLFCHKYYVRSF